MYRRAGLWLLVSGLFFRGTSAAAAGSPEEALAISPEMTRRLIELRKEPKFADPNGVIQPHERARIEPLINTMLDRLIADLPRHAKRSWALEEMRKAVAQFYLEDTEVREVAVEYIARTLRILGIRNTNGVFDRYLISL